MSFINKEIYRINDFLGKNENINVIYSQKNTKFGKQKYTYNKYQKNEKELKNEPKNISEKWLVQKYTIVDITLLLHYFILFILLLLKI